MGTTVASRQVLRWTLRVVAPSVRSPLQVGRCLLQPQRVRCESFCSSTRQYTLQRNHIPNRVSEKPATELSLQSLVDMGFTDSQAEQMYESVSKVRGGAKRALSALTALSVLGLNPASVLKLMQKCPQLCTVSEAQLQLRIENLRKLGLVEGSLQKMVSHYPQILTVPQKTVKQVVAFLRAKCLFTVQQVTDILSDSPAIVMENPSQVEYKFQYVYFQMGVKQAEMVKSRLFRFTLDEIRCRHCFLERRGMYQTPDKKGQTVIVNPKLDSILNVDQDTFVTQIAKASAEEYEVFQRLMAREWYRQEEYGSIESDIDDDQEEEEEEDDDDEEEEEATGKDGYGKRRKKWRRD